MSARCPTRRASSIWTCYHHGLVLPADGGAGMGGNAGDNSLPRPVLPHPRLQDRAFVVLPLADLAPHWRHPVSGLGIAAIVAALPADQVTEAMDE